MCNSHNNIKFAMEIIRLAYTILVGLIKYSARTKSLSSRDPLGANLLTSPWPGVGKRAPRDFIVPHRHCIIAHRDPHYSPPGLQSTLQGLNSTLKGLHHSLQGLHPPSRGLQYSRQRLRHRGCIIADDRKWRPMGAT